MWFMVGVANMVYRNTLLFYKPPLTKILLRTSSLGTAMSLYTDSTLESSPEAALAAGLTPKAIQAMVAAEELRGTATIDDADCSYLPPKAAAECAALLTKAFASANYNGFRPDSTKPVMLGVSALNILLAECREFPELPNRIPHSAFNNDSFDTLSCWAMERETIPDPALVDEKQGADIISKINRLGSETLNFLYRDGSSHILKSDDVPVDPNGERIEACILSIAKACRFGRFSQSDYLELEMDTSEVSVFASQIIESHGDFFKRAEEISADRDEALSSFPHHRVEIEPTRVRQH